MDAIATTTQQTIAAVHSVTTSDKRYTIHWPLPPAKPLPVELHVTPATRYSAILRRINELLNRGHSVICPVTGKLIRIYRRGLHASQISTLRRLRDKSDKLGVTFLHVEFFSVRRDGDLAKLELWGLAQRMRPENKLEAEEARGKWRILPHGRAFLAGSVRIPRQVAMLEGERLGYVDESDTITVHDIPSTFSPESLAAGTDGMPTKED